MDKSLSSVVKNFNPKKNFWRQQWKDIITISHKLAKKSGGGGGGGGGVFLGRGGGGGGGGGDEGCFLVPWIMGFITKSLWILLSIEINFGENQRASDFFPCKIFTLIRSPSALLRLQPYLLYFRK